MGDWGREGEVKECVVPPKPPLEQSKIMSLLGDASVVEARSSAVAPVRNVDFILNDISKSLLKYVKLKL